MHVAVSAAGICVLTTTTIIREAEGDERTERDRDTRQRHRAKAKQTNLPQRLECNGPGVPPAQPTLPTNPDGAFTPQSHKHRPRCASSSTTTEAVQLRTPLTLSNHAAADPFLAALVAFE